MKRLISLNVVIIFIICLMCCGCEITEVHSYKTFVMDQGNIHFSVEYPANYKIDYLHPAEVTGTNSQQSALLFLVGPTNRDVNNYTHIGIGVCPPDNLVPNAENSTEQEEINAASWKNYKLLYKGKITINGISAYRLDYQNIDIVQAIAGDGELGIEVFRRVDFDANGYVWTIYIQSHSFSAEADKVIFEHILETFKILS